MARRSRQARRHSTLACATKARRAVHQLAADHSRETCGLVQDENPGRGDARTQAVHLWPAETSVPRSQAQLERLSRLRLLVLSHADECTSRFRSDVLRLRAGTRTRSERSEW